VAKKSVASKKTAPADSTRAKPRVPPVAPAPTYTRPSPKPKKTKGSPGPIKRLVKFVRGDYTKKA